MTYEQAISMIANVQQTAMNEIVKRQYFVLIFADKHGELYGYDTKLPANCLKSVLDKHADFKFVHIIAESTEQAVRSLCATLRQSRDILERIKAVCPDALVTS